MKPNLVRPYSSAKSLLAKVRAKRRLHFSFLAKTWTTSHHSQSASNALLSTCPCTVDKTQNGNNIISNAIEKL